MTEPYSDAFENFTHSKREFARIDRIIGLLRSEWLADPDMRLGQLVSNLAASGGWTGEDVFYVEDDLIEDELRARRAAEKLFKQFEDGTLGEDA